MALYEFFHRPRDIFHPLAGDLVVSDDHLIQTSYLEITASYHGNFVYDDEGSILSGNVTGFELVDTANGGLQVRVTGLDIDVTLWALVLFENYEAMNHLWLLGDDTVVGSPGADSLQGWEGRDSISAGAGNDFLVGADDQEIDTLAGGLGDDTYRVGGNGSAADLIVEAANAGHDTVVSIVSYVLPANVEDLVLQGLAGTLVGTGNELDNYLRGSDTNDLLVGMAGNDTLEAGFGDDTLRGGAGNDTYLLSNSGGGRVEESGGGVDTVVTGYTHTLADGIENLTLVGHLSVEGHGNALANVIKGNDEGNVLDGGAGADTLIGGMGNDLFVVDSLDDVVQDAGGTDTLRTSIDGYMLADGSTIENIELSGSAASAAGNAGANRLVGNPWANTLYGLGGDDTLVGDGSDTLVGGAGNDTYAVSGDATIVEFAGGGSDTVRVAISYALGSQLENLVLATYGLTGTGNELANVITGTDGFDVLDGRAGADTLDGGGGHDLFYVDSLLDVVITGDLGAEGDGDGIYSSISYDLARAAGVENLFLLGTQDLDATGNALANYLVGNDGNNVLTAVAGFGGDWLVGGAGRDRLQGSGADDTLDGGTGADTMVGGTGRDVFVVDDAADVVSEGSSFISGGEGDRIQAWVSFTNAAYVEFLELMGSQAIDATGTAAGNETLIGNDAANVLHGGGGMNDELFGMGGDDWLDDGGGYARMYGGSGNDTYTVGGLYWIVEEAGQGIDTVRASGSLTLGANLENLVMMGSALEGNGNALANLITGNADANFIDGKAGADTMMGGLGDDQYYVDDAGDSVIEADGEGYDSIVTYGVSISLVGTSVERVYGEQSGAVDFSITGNAQANFLRGSDGRNLIDGGAGADEMYGFWGNDTYVVDDAGDHAWEFDSHDSADWVWSKLASYTLPDFIEHLQLLDGAVAGTGNALANRLHGNALGNRLDGAAGNDTLEGGAGDDTLVAGLGNDWLDGDTGNDHTVFAGSRASYTIASSAGVITVSGAEGIDVLMGIDVLDFADQSVVLNEHFVTGSVQVTGEMRQNRVLTAAIEGAADQDGLAGAPQYQWFRNGDAITGATSGTYKTALADVDTAISVRVRFVDGLGNLETLWSGSTPAIAAGDTTPPQVWHFAPRDLGTEVTADGNLVVLFTEDVLQGTGDILLKTSAGALVERFGAGSSQVTVDRFQLTVDPTALLDYGTNYVIELASGSVVDLEDNPLAGMSLAFRTVPAPDVTPPVVSAFLPVQGSANAAPTSSDLLLMFSETVARGDGAIVLKTAAGTVVETFDVSTSGRLQMQGSSVVINPTLMLVPGTGYRVEVAAGTFVDAAGNALATAGSYSFTTRAASAVSGAAGNDSLDGGNATDWLRGLDGNDTLNGLEGGDVLDGGSGRDTVVYWGSRSQYDFTKTAGGLEVARYWNHDVADTLIGIERIRFADVYVAFDVTGNAGQAYRLYQAAFDRVPDIGGLGFQMNALDIGFRLTDIAANFIESPEFSMRYGALNNVQFVTQLYANVLHRAPDQGGLDFHVNNLQLGLPRYYLLAQFSESPENQANVIGAIQDGMAYTL